MLNLFFKETQNKEILHYWSLAFLTILFLANSFPAYSSVIRGPYLQSGTPTSVTIKWRTSSSTDSKVWYGSSPNSLYQTEVVSGDRRDHKVKLSGLTPGTVYYYAIGDTDEQEEGADEDHYFKTAPTVGSSSFVRAWILGDCGTGSSDQRAVRDAYYDYVGNNHTDMILLLGDNAYSDGTDDEYQDGLFDVYDDQFKQSMLWSCPGNHEYRDEDGLSADYYDIFTFPKNGEAGGLASNTEKYYSFDHGNIHIITLDTHDEDMDEDSPMLTWLENDLGSTAQEWIVVMFHHPPYSKGSNDSDDSNRQSTVRENIIPICEAYGVDLILSGHSHSYERSKLIHGHYGYSNSYSSSTHNIDGGDGRVNGDGAYKQNGSEEGTVYIVTGSAGKRSSVGDHPIMYYAKKRLGSTIMEVQGDQMNLKFLNRYGEIEDYFTITQNGSSTNGGGGNNNGIITTNWIHPNNGDVFSNTTDIPLVADANNTNVAIEFVEFFIDGIPIGKDYNAPYTRSWTPPSTGNYILKITAVDEDGGQISNDITITVSGGAPPTTSTSTSIAVPIRSGDNDVEEKQSNGLIYAGSSDLELVNDSGNNQKVGLRFENLSIPSGAIITNAYLQFTADETDSGTTNLTIFGEDDNNASAYWNSSFNISSRATTSASVNWAPAPWTSVGASGSAQQSPNLKTIVQEIVDKSGWAEGNAMAFVIRGTGSRVAYSYNRDPAKAPVLHVTYSTGGGGSTAGCIETAVDQNDFEDDWGIWNDGGSDARFSSNDNYASSGEHTIRLKGSSSSSHIVTDAMDFSDYEELTVDFSFVTRYFDSSNDDIWLQLSTDDGDNFTNLKKWNWSDDFSNVDFNNAHTVFPGPFTSETKLRIRCDASSDEVVYIDDLEITGCHIASSNLQAPDHWDEGPEISPAEAQQKRLILYPNPTMTELVVNYKSHAGQPTLLQMINQKGEEVMTRDWSVRMGYNELRLDVGALASGLYVIRLVEAGRVVFGEVVVCE